MVGLRGARTCLGTGKTKDVNWSWEELLGPLRGRTPVLLFDSDVNSNPEVRHALLDLRDALVRAGCTVYIAVIGETGKVGPDDFLAKYGPDEVRRLLDSRLPSTVAGRLGLARTPAAVRTLSQDLVFLAMLERTEPAEFVDTMMRMRGAGVSGHALNGMRRRASSR